MKAALTFLLPEDRDEYRAASEGMHCRCVLREFDEWLRQQIKYCDLSEETTAAFTDAREKLYELANDQEISLDW